MGPVYLMRSVALCALRPDTRNFSVLWGFEFYAVLFGFPLCARCRAKGRSGQGLGTPGLMAFENPFEASKVTVGD